MSIFQAKEILVAKYKWSLLYWPIEEWHNAIRNVLIEHEDRKL